MSEQNWLKRLEKLFLAGCLSLCAMIIILGGLSVRHEQQYVYLADSFLHGQLNFRHMPGQWHDTALYDGQHYWPLGPLPAVFLIPFLLLFQSLGIEFYQAYVAIPLALGTGWRIVSMARSVGRGDCDAIWLALAFCAASSFLSVSVITMSWSFAHIVAVFLLFWAIHEWCARRRWCVIGLLVGLVAATRVSAGLNMIFFLAAAGFLEKDQRIRKLVYLSIGFAVPLFFLGIYNFARFDSVIEGGYSYQPAAPGDFPTTSWANVLPHLGIFLFGLPDFSNHFPYVITNPAGMSVLLISPWLLCLRRLDFDRTTQLALANCAVVLVVILAWRSSGQIQVGYRFILDFLPMLLFLIARTNDGLNGLPGSFKTLSTLGFMSSAYFLKTFIEIIPKG